MKKYLGIAAAVSLAALMAGCTPEARQDVGDAGAKVDSAVAKSAEGTAERVAKTGDAVAEGTAKAVDATAKAGEKVAETTAEAGHAVKEGVKETGAAVKEGAKNTAEYTKEAAGGVAKGVENAAMPVSVTPKIKNALILDKGIDASTINVDTNAAAKTVVLKGTQPTAAKKKLAGDIAQKALSDNPDFKVQNNITVSGS